MLKAEGVCVQTQDPEGVGTNSKERQTQFFSQVEQARRFTYKAQKPKRGERHFGGVSHRG